MALIRDSPDQFQVVFRELVRRGRRRARDPIQVDPYLIGRAIAEVMQACTVRAANGDHLLWNEYRVLLARSDFEPLRVLHATLERDLRHALAADVQQRGAQLIGDLAITLVVDESNELEPGRAIVRVAFAPNAPPVAAAAGELTVRFDTRAVAEHIAAMTSGASTVFVADHPAEAAATFRLQWSAGEATVPSDALVVVGRPHANPPARFIGLAGASARINKQHLVLATGPSAVRITRPPSANPVHVNGQPIAPGADLDATPPLEISLSRGDLVLTLSRVHDGRG